MRIQLNPPWQPLSKTALSKIQGLIAERALGPGDRLPGQRELAEALKISRPAIREAFAMLETVGAVRIVPGRGVFLSEKSDRGTPDLEAAWHFSDRSSPQEIYQLRFAIEGFAARMAARRADGRTIEHLLDLNSRMKSSLRNGDVIAAAGVDFDFHLTIVRLTGNRAMEQILGTIDRLVLETQMMPLRTRERLYEPIEEHLSIVSAIQRGDAELAGVMMRYHITRAAGRVGAPFRAG
jgi:GntR family transcriptional repressor for pyruvate dehydrogenase complex